MGKNLVGTQVLDQLLDAEGVQIVMDVLMNSDHAADLQLSAPDNDLVDEIEAALGRNLFRSMRKLVEIAPPQPRKLISIQLNRWDLVNVITMIRAKEAGSSKEETLRALVPAGEFGLRQLEILCEEDSVQDMANALTTWGSPYGSQLRMAILAQTADQDLTDLELRLFLAYFDWALSELNPKDKNDSLLIRSLRLQADLINVIALLRRAELRRKQVPLPELSLLSHGSISASIFREMEKAQSLDHAIEILERTAFAPAVEKGVLALGSSGKLSVFERFLEAELIWKHVLMYRSDPLSAAVPIGFIWRKVSEYQNLRMITRGKKYKLPRNTIREALILV